MCECASIRRSTSTTTSRLAKLDRTPTHRAYQTGRHSGAGGDPSAAGPASGLEEKSTNLCKAPANPTVLILEGERRRPGGAGPARSDDRSSLGCVAGMKSLRALDIREQAQLSCLDMSEVVVRDDPTPPLARPSASTAMGAAVVGELGEAVGRPSNPAPGCRPPETLGRHEGPATRVDSPSVGRPSAFETIKTRPAGVGQDERTPRPESGRGGSASKSAP